MGAGSFLQHTHLSSVCPVGGVLGGRGCSQVSAAQVQVVESGWSVHHHTEVGTALSKECANNHITPPSLADSSHRMVLGQGP